MKKRVKKDIKLEDAPGSRPPDVEERRLNPVFPMFGNQRDNKNKLKN